MWTRVLPVWTHCVILPICECHHTLDHSQEGSEISVFGKRACSTDMSLICQSLHRNMQFSDWNETQDDGLEARTRLAAYTTERLFYLSPQHLVVKAKTSASYELFKCLVATKGDSSFLPDTSRSFPLLRDNSDSSTFSVRHVVLVPNLTSETALHSVIPPKTMFAEDHLRIYESVSARNFTATCSQNCRVIFTGSHHGGHGFSLLVFRMRLHLVSNPGCEPFCVS